jgi:TolB protein
MNDRIAFVSERSGTPETYLMDPDGSGQERLTFNSLYESDLAWSPDGARLAFRDSGPQDIYVMNADGTGVGNLSDVAGTTGDSDSAWSPDGRRIAFTSHTAGQAEVYVMDADGGNHSLDLQ